VFYVRLLITDMRNSKFVELFFRDVVDSVVDEAVMRRVEIGTDDSDYAFPQEIGSCGHTLDT
jgi:hypothetical protein